MGILVKTSYIAEVLWTSLVKTGKKMAHWDIFYDFLDFTSHKRHFSANYMTYHCTQASIIKQASCGPHW